MEKEKCNGCIYFENHQYRLTEEERDYGEMYCFLYGKNVLHGCNEGEIVKDFGQWKVHRWGLAAASSDVPYFVYDISKERLNDGWEYHLSKKNWIDLDSFKKAYEFAKEYYSKAK